MKKGFTLIELLAVIVILAVIALIATPIVLSIIEETKESAVLRSAEHYLSAVELSIAKKNLTAGGSFSPIECEIREDGNLLCDGKETLEVEISGEAPIYGTITFEKGKIIDHKLNYNEDTTVINGELIYEEPIKLCTANTKKATALIWDKANDPGHSTSYETGEIGLLASEDGAYTPGVAYTCNFIDDSEKNNMTFFVLSETKNYVTLISADILDGYAYWSVDGSNHKDESEDAQAVTAKAELADKVSNWSIVNGGKLDERQMSTIKLPTMHQIAEAGGQTYTGSRISGLPIWLTSNTVPTYGFWTSTPDVNSSVSAWCVEPGGSSYLRYVNEENSDWAGLRAVITISKSNF